MWGKKLQNIIQLQAYCFTERRGKSKVCILIKTTAVCVFNYGSVLAHEAVGGITQVKFNFHLH
jgi:hypothetical protein